MIPNSFQRLRNGGGQRLVAAFMAEKHGAGVIQVLGGIKVRKGHAGRALYEAFRQRKAEALVLAGQNRYIGNAVKGEQFGLRDKSKQMHMRGGGEPGNFLRIG